jgi:hypothetical protein
MELTRIQIHILELLCPLHSGQIFGWCSADIFQHCKNSLGELNGQEFLRDLQQLRELGLVTFNPRKLRYYASALGRDVFFDETSNSVKESD